MKSHGRCNEVWAEPMRFQFLMTGNFGLRSKEYMVMAGLRLENYRIYLESSLIIFRIILGSLFLLSWKDRWMSVSEKKKTAWNFFITKTAVFTCMYKHTFEIKSFAHQTKKYKQNYSNQTHQTQAPNLTSTDETGRTREDPKRRKTSAPQQAKCKTHI